MLWWTERRMSMKVMNWMMVVTPFWKIDFVPCAALAGMGCVLENLTCWWKNFWQWVCGQLVISSSSESESLKCG